MTTTHPGPASTATDDPVFAERYRAIASRDRRFDGQFVTAVRTTRIYCRPSCPARTPRPENVTFYLTSAAAHEAGYRACKRCLPEAVPGTPSWDLGHDLAARAMRLVGDGVVDREGVDGLAARLGYTPRHVHRVLVAELGAGPVALARALRAQTARALLTGTDLRLADVAFAAGFGSVRQFNDTVAEVFDTTPGELRRRARPAVRPAVRTVTAPAAVGDAPPAEGPDARTATLDLVLPLREPYDARGVFAFLAARAVAGVEVVDASDPTHLSYARTVALPHGPGAFRATYGPLPDGGAARGPARRGGSPRFRVELELTSVADLPAAIARVRRLFDLDADSHAVDAALAADPALAGAVRSTPGVRVPGAVDGAEILVRALVGQQISVAAARTHLSRLAEALGAPFASRFGPTRLFPTAERIAADGAAHLRGPARRTAAVLGAARAIADGDLAVSPADDPAGLRTALEALPGVGPWTSGYVAMRVLHDPDVLLDGDLALRAGARALGLPDDRRALVAHAERWAPWRSYAAMHLWRATAPDRPDHPDHPGRPDRPGDPPGGDVTATTTRPTTTPSTAVTTSVATPDGPFTLVVAPDGAVLASGWTDDVGGLVALVHPSLRPAEAEPVPEDHPAVATAVGAVRAYYAGDVRAIDDVPVRQASGPYRAHAWDVLRTVEPGDPVTYTRYAELSGRPAAVRAAAGACAMNAAALFVPCHRVLRTDGSLGGYRYGLTVKRSLLDREREASGDAATLAV